MPFNTNTPPGSFLDPRSASHLSVSHRSAIRRASRSFFQFPDAAHRRATPRSAPQHFASRRHAPAICLSVYLPATSRVSARRSTPQLSATHSTSQSRQVASILVVLVSGRLSDCAPRRNAPQRSSARRFASHQPQLASLPTFSVGRRASARSASRSATRLLAALRISPHRNAPANSPRSRHPQGCRAPGKSRNRRSTTTRNTAPRAAALRNTPAKLTRNP